MSDLTLSTSVTLLRCPNCGNDLSGLSTDRIFLCSSCGRCWVLGETLEQVDIGYSMLDSPDSMPMPFWRVEADVAIRSRMTRDASSANILEGPREYDGSELRLKDTGGATSREVFVFPAFATSLVLSTGVSLHGVQFPETRLESGSVPLVVGGTVDRDDTGELTRGVAIGREVSAMDFLASVDIDVSILGTSILALGCFPDGSYLGVGEGPLLKIPFTAIIDWEDIADAHGRG